MNPNRESPDPGLIDKLLADENWAAANDAIWKTALSSLKLRRQERRAKQFIAGCTCLMVLAAAVRIEYLKSSTIAFAAVTGDKTGDTAVEKKPEASSKAVAIDDNQLLDLLHDQRPVLVNINGRSELILLNADPAGDTSPQ